MKKNRFGMVLITIMVSQDNFYLILNLDARCVTKMARPNEFNLQEVACKVYSVLLKTPNSRDSDRILLSKIWGNEIEQMGEGKSFIEMFEAGLLSNPESICRMRRKLQEVQPSLRGEKWDSRHNIEGSICQQLTFFDRW